MSIGKVGSKGELFPPKKMREKMGLKEGQRVLYRIVQEKMVIEKVATFEELITKPTKITITIDELKEDRKRLAQEAEQ